RVLQQLGCDEHVVGRRLGVVENRTQLREMPGAEQVRDLEHRGLREERERFGIDLYEPAAAGLERRHVVAGEEAIGSLVGSQREQLLVGELRHAITVPGLVANTVLGEGRSRWPTTASSTTRWARCGCRPTRAGARRRSVPSRTSPYPASASM